MILDPYLAAAFFERMPDNTEAAFGLASGALDRVCKSVSRGFGKPIEVKLVRVWQVIELEIYNSKAEFAFAYNLTEAKS